MAMLATTTIDGARTSLRHGVFAAMRTSSPLIDPVTNVRRQPLAETIAAEELCPINVQTAFAGPDWPWVHSLIPGSVVAPYSEERDTVPPTPACLPCHAPLRRRTATGKVFGTQDAAMAATLLRAVRAGARTPASLAIRNPGIPAMPASLERRAGFSGHSTAPKACPICSAEVVIDYKNVQMLSQFVNDTGTIQLRSVTGEWAWANSAAAASAGWQPLRPAGSRLLREHWWSGGRVVLNIDCTLLAGVCAKQHRKLTTAIKQARQFGW